MGAVYQVMDTLNQNRVLAVKEMSDSAVKDPEEKLRAVRMFEQEAHLLTNTQTSQPALCYWTGLPFRIGIIW